MMRSIVHGGDRCYICGAYSRVLVATPMVMDSALNEKQAREDGLLCNLCDRCYIDLAMMGTERAWLRKQAQAVWIRYYSKPVVEFQKKYKREQEA